MNPVFEKWRARESKDKNFTKKLLSFGLVSNDNEINSAFNKRFFFIENKIIAQVGIGTNLFNEYTITAISQALANVLRLKNIQNQRILVCNDYTFRSQLYSGILSRVLNEHGYTICVPDQDEKLPGIYHKNLAEHNNISLRVYISNFKDVKNTMQMGFYWGDGKDFSEQDILLLSSELNKANYIHIDIPEQMIEIENIKYKNSIFQEIFNKNYSKYTTINTAKFGVHCSSINDYKFTSELLKQCNFRYSLKKLNQDKHWFIAHPKQLTFLNTSTFFNKNDANFAINNSGSGLTISYKHKGVYKYLTSSQVASIYLYFKLNHDQHFDKSSISKYTVARSINTDSLVNKIVNKHNIEVIEFTHRSQLFDKAKNKNILLAFNNNFEYMLDSKSLIFDAHLFMLEMMRVIEYYKAQNMTLFDVLQTTYTEFGYSHTTEKTYDLDKNSVGSFFNRLKNLEKIGNQKIVSSHEYINNSLSTNVYLKINFAQGDKAVLSYDALSEKVSILTDVKLTNNQTDKVDLIVREKEVLDNILDLKETSTTRKTKPFTVIKYLFLVAFLFGIFIFLFNSVYNFKDSDNVGTANIRAIFETMWEQINTNQLSKASFVAFVVGFIIYSIINAIIFKRLLGWQGVKAKFSDLLIGSLISLVSQNITPKSIGGDLATYWFLRRRNIPRAQLVSSIVVNTFIWQISNLILIAIFIPIGIKFYGNFFANLADKRVLIMLISLILGITIDTTLALGFLLLSMSAKAQNFILKMLVKTLEWMPFVNLYDPESLSSKYQYEFYKIRFGLKNVMRNWFNFIEILFWKLLPWFYVPVAWFAVSTDMLQSGLQGGSYFNMLVANVLIRNINSISPTPGGIGTSDAISKTIYEFIIKPDEINGYSAVQRSSLLTSIRGMGEIIIPTLLSAFTLLLVFIGEKRIDLYRAKAKNESLVKNKNIVTTTKTGTKFYKITFSILPILLFAGSLTFILI
ncbi:lysylphosphatidylglycerol synthase transmembrane domain-containing protein [Mycoplasma simbae]|uniref:lysylphosphatidylglycerol synthase transmembrane domain-containing protein n=1 Tax=Mycoplasma simbae TaxID=36744 RepID=UPI000496E601|nr:lysylphosphatidylglycerol synthase transmembrane domain-containing protein [Mycoplasma simbae]